MAAHLQGPCNGDMMNKQVTSKPYSSVLLLTGLAPVTVSLISDFNLPFYFFSVRGEL